MKISKSNDSNKSKSSKPSNSTQVLALAQSLDSMVRQLKDSVQVAAQAGDSFDKTERHVREMIARMGFLAMQLFINLQGDGDLGQEIQGANAKTLKRSQATVATKIRSVFGTHHFEQFNYAPGLKKAIELRPISARMSLPERQWSFLLQEFSQMFCVDQAYEQAMKNLEAIFGGSFAVDTAEQINGELGRSAGRFVEDLPKPEQVTEGKIMVATGDCKGVPLVKEDAPKVLPFEVKKKKPGNRRMATVASVYSVDPYIRTPEEVTAALFRDDIEPETVKPDRPKPKNKNTTAHFPTLEDNGDGTKVPISGIVVAMAWILGQIHLRRRIGQVLVVIMDGQESLWHAIKMGVSFGARTVAVLDILHALSYVWQAAALFEKTDDARKAFTRERLLRILKGEVRGVIRGLRRLGATRGLSGKSMTDLKRICGYLENNADRMKYDEYLRRGYPIASGVIEGACRHLVKDRMERSGMRWTLEGARSMLNLRAVFQSDHWSTFLSRNMEIETCRVHAHREVLSEYEPLTLAC
jgi:hypothetical protein